MHEAEKVDPAHMVYFFGQGRAEGDPTRKDILGGKGAGLADMTRAGLPVPPGFTISIACCRYYHRNGGRWPDGLAEAVRKYVARLEVATGRKFGEGADPLLVSVRSGAARSMPGMMDTILNCGLCPGLEKGVADKARFWTVYAQFARQFGTTVAGIPADAYRNAAARCGLVPDRRKATAEAYIALYEKQTGGPFPSKPWDALDACINAVFDSWNNERAVIYRTAHGLDALDGTAVNVQSMFDSEVSGVAFTANPARPSAREIVIESSYGLGEAIVSGDVTPDRFVLDSSTGEITERTLGKKGHVFCGLRSRRDPASLDPDASSLTDDQIAQLAQIALDVEEHFGFPVDIEWGIEQGRFALLQSRAVRGLEVARDQEAGRLAEVERLRGVLDGKRKVWVVHNLAETLKAPTPLTWDIIGRFMSGAGGFGQMYVDFGNRPSARVRDDGFLDLICGRIYADPDRAAELFWEGMPYRYDPDEILADPRVLEAAPMKFDAARADEKFLLRLPGTICAMIRSSRAMKRARAGAARIFEEEALPPYRAYIERKRSQDLSELETSALLGELRERTHKVLTEFGKESLKPGFFGGCALAELEQMLTQLLGTPEGPRLCQVLSSGLEGDVTVEQNELLFQVGRGAATMEGFLEKYGHRAVDEMELAKPRFREDPSYLNKILESQKKTPQHSPGSRHTASREKRTVVAARLPATLAQWGGSFMRERIERVLAEAQTLLPYRETGKHYLMMGYELIRRAIVELGKRWDLGDDVFYLKLDELGRFERDAEALRPQIAQRKVRWQSAQRLDLPGVIDSAHLDELGLPRKIEAARELKAVALAPGVFSGAARIVFSPEEATDLGDDCVLVCPSTDPSWTALFTTIKGLIVERGGVLSHGAITARDFGIPAVACPDTTGIVTNGQRVRVDGDGGRVTILEE